MWSGYGVGNDERELSKMKLKLLGFYDLFLSFYALILSVAILSSCYGFNIDYEYTSIDSYEPYGIMLILGFGNLLAAVFCFQNKNNKAWFTSFILGLALLLICVIIRINLGNWDIFIRFFILSVLQIILSGNLYFDIRRLYENRRMG